MTLCYPNRYGYHFLWAMHDVLGRSGLNAVLNLAELSQYIDDFPPDTSERAFTMAHFAQLHLGMLLMAGRKMGAGLAHRTGRVFFQRSYPTHALNAPLDALTNLLTFYLDFRDTPAFTVQEETDCFLCQLEICPLCWGLTPQTVPLRMGKVDVSPICSGLTGFLQEGLQVLTGQNYAVTEIMCHAQGQTHCAFRCEKS